MIEHYWNKLHFWTLTSPWKGKTPESGRSENVEMGRTLFYDVYLEKRESGWTLVTKLGGSLGAYAFSIALVFYAVFIFGFARGFDIWGPLILLEIYLFCVCGGVHAWTIHLNHNNYGADIRNLSGRLIAVSD